MSTPLDTLRVTTCGSVDDGKSTLIGRLLLETGALKDDQVADAHRGGQLDLALLTDGLRAEREQGITIDVSYRYFQTPRRKFILADTPGHVQYTRNMATGASTAQLALLLVDAKQGLTRQTMRHAFIASLLGIRHCVLVVNKMDLVNFSEDRFEEVCQDFRDWAARLDIPDLQFVPVCALAGDNVVETSARTPWYTGRALLPLLEETHVGSDRNLIALRFPIQLVLVGEQAGRPFRGYAGQVASGVVRPGDTVMILPSRKVTRVQQVLLADQELEEAFPPRSVTLTFADDLDVSRGDLIVHANNRPRRSLRFEAMLVWLDDQKPLETGRPYLLKHGAVTVQCEVEELRYVTDVETLRRRPGRAQLKLNGIGRVVLAPFRPLYVDPYRVNRATGSLILIDPLTHATAAAGMVLEQEVGPPASEIGVPIDPADRRAELLGQRGCVLWFTGLSGAGKTTLARLLEEALLDEGRLTYLLDADVVRTGLNADLGYDSASRSENVRRLGELARTLADSGSIVLVASIAPFAADRARVRERIGSERFLEIYVATSLKVCQERDVKGLYAKSASGELKGMTGIDSPYEPPTAPNLTLDTATTSRVSAIGQLLEAGAQVWTA